MPEHTLSTRGRCWAAGLAFLSALTLVAATPRASHADGSELRNSPIVKAVNAAAPSVVNINGRKTVRAHDFIG